MKLHFDPLHGPRRPFTEPPNGHLAEVGGACPHCGAMPLEVEGRGMRIVDDRRYESAAHCTACSLHVGTLIAVADTLFGIREDKAVLEHGRARVYGTERRRD